MNSVVRTIRETLCASGWVDMTVGTSRHLDLVLKRSFAVVGVVFSARGHDALQRWILAQGELAEIRESIGRNHDLYLLICLPEIDSATMDQLPTVIGDTHVCRKLVVELRGRSVDEALLDVPLLLWQALGNGSDDIGYVELAESSISPLLIDDLGMKSPERILEAWLDGRYDRHEDDDAS